MEQISWNQYQKYKEWRKDLARIHYSQLDPNAPYHKMTTAEKMSRKRLKKLMMATGVSVRDAEKRLNGIRCVHDIQMNTGSPYLNWWRTNLTPAVKRIAKHNEKPQNEKYLAARQQRELDELYRLNMIFELYPDMNSEDDVSAEWTKCWKEGVSYHANFDYEGMVKFSILMKGLRIADAYFRYLEWCRNVGRESY